MTEQVTALDEEQEQAPLATEQGAGLGQEHGQASTIGAIEVKESTLQV